MVFFPAQLLFSFSGMKKLVVIWILFGLTAMQLGSLLSNYATPFIHALCYGKVFKRIPTAADQVLILDSVTYARALTDDHEISIDGELFDIHSIRRTARGIILHAAKDEHETRLLEIINHLKQAVKQASKKHPAGKNLPSSLLKWYCSNKQLSQIDSFHFTLAIKACSPTPALLPGDQLLPLQPPDVFLS